jgi:hypothetical protein
MKGMCTLCFLSRGINTYYINKNLDCEKFVIKCERCDILCVIDSVNASRMMYKPSTMYEIEYVFYNSEF